jgi:hypothetical protein
MSTQQELEFLHPYQERAAASTCLDHFTYHLPLCPSICHHSDRLVGLLEAPQSCFPQPYG